MRALFRSALTLLIAAFAASSVLAGDSNEAAGFSSNHILADGGFGENIDLMSGSLNLSFPVGPTYQVGPSLNYQVLLTYNSNIWAYDDRDGTTVATIPGRVTVNGCFGVGVRGHMGRVFRE